MPAPSFPALFSLAAGTNARLEQTEKGTLTPADPAPVLLGQGPCQHSSVKDGWKGAAALRFPRTKAISHLLGLHPSGCGSWRLHLFLQP